MTAQWIEKALELTAGEPSYDTFWTFKDGQLQLWVNCSDSFYWGCADAEEITEANLPELETARNDLIAAGDTQASHLANLFASRVRKIRPQGALYEYIEPELYPLFNACGPHRPVDLGNPVSTPENPVEE
jgi:hypothetical protein